MWCIVEVQSNLQLWFSDGEPVDSIRGGNGASARLIVDQMGFLDITEQPTRIATVLSANGSLLRSGIGISRIADEKDACVQLRLEITNGNFKIEVVPDGSTKSRMRIIRRYLSMLNCNNAGFHETSSLVTGRLKSLPEISDADISFIDEMIIGRYIPYQGDTDAPGQSPGEIATLGRQLFPFSPYGYRLALCVYDWTTPSFARLVFMKIFQYRNKSPNYNLIDIHSIAKSIWASDWDNCTPQNAEYMKSFMMGPASSLEDVEHQLHSIAARLYEFSEVQNRLLSAAMQSLPRTSVLSTPRLYSGQPDISQLGLDDFCIEFEECPSNDHSLDRPLKGNFLAALNSYMRTGQTITTKMVMSFTDRLEDAMTYSNGILLVADPPADADVWEGAAYISPLSNDPKKNEYTFIPGTQFKINSVSKRFISGSKMYILALQPKE